MCNNKDDIKLTDTKSTKLDAERSKREDFYGKKGIVDENGILTMETGEKYDLNQPIEDAVL